MLLKLMQCLTVYISHLAENIRPQAERIDTLPTFEPRLVLECVDTFEFTM